MKKAKPKVRTGDRIFTNPKLVLKKKKKSCYFRT